MAATRRSALVAASAILLFTLGCSTDTGSLTEATTDGSAAAASRSALDVSVSIASEVRGAGPVVAHVTVTNRGPVALEVPESQLPSEDLETPQFVVQRNGTSVRYAGPHIKRGPVDVDPIITIAAGASFSYDIDLSRAYDLTQDGRYAITYASGGSDPAALALRSETQTVRLVGRLATGGLGSQPLSTLTSLITYTNCTATQQTDVRAALGQAETYANNASAYMVANKLGERYTWWFGDVNTPNAASTVKNNYAKIADAFATKAVTVDCGCKKQYYAYVYANQPYKIYVCRAFWSAPLAGTDSRGGTLIHEMSHFTVVAGTNDWAYGQTNAHNLALTDVAKAISNADNHEYFAENTPVRQ